MSYQPGFVAPSSPVDTSGVAVSTLGSDVNAANTLDALNNQMPLGTSPSDVYTQQLQYVAQGAKVCQAGDTACLNQPNTPNPALLGASILLVLGTVLIVAMVK